MIQRALEVYEQVAKPQAISRIGLRYINRLEIPEQQEIEIEHFLLAVPIIPGGIPQTFGRWMQRVEIPLLEANGLLVVHSGSVVEEEQANITFLLDLDLSTLQTMSVKLDYAMEWVERAHDEIEKAFEACITPEARRLFGEEEQHGDEQDDRAKRG
jgi:uncharacterized protein (TIGR04255 family)